MEAEVSKSFKNWSAEEVELTFGVTRTWESQALDEWLNADVSVTPEDREDLAALCKTARFKIDSWNEAALKFFLIAPLINQVDFASSSHYNGFLEQTLTISNEAASARGNVDFMVATGREKPRAPFYLLHEYKPETTTVLDPKGQLLIAMLAAQRANNAAGVDYPVFGTYVIGRLWFMVYLQGEEYTISKAFDVTEEEDILVIFKCLLEVKKQTEARVALKN